MLQTGQQEQPQTSSHRGKACPQSQHCDRITHSTPAQTACMQADFPSPCTFHMHACIPCLNSARALPPLIARAAGCHQSCTRHTQQLEAPVGLTTCRTLCPLTPARWQPTTHSSPSTAPAPPPPAALVSRQAWQQPQVWAVCHQQQQCCRQSPAAAQPWCCGADGCCCGCGL